MLDYSAASAITCAGSISRLGKTLRTRGTEAIGEIRSKPGNILVMMLCDPEHPENTLLFEIFEDAAAIEAHHAAAHTARNGPAIHALLGKPMHTRRFETQDRSELCNALGRPLCSSQPNAADSGK